VYFNAAASRNIAHDPDIGEVDPSELTSLFRALSFQILPYPYVDFSPGVVC
jgi:hypothetical protein